jgi:HEAT repeat protein
MSALSRPISRRSAARLLAMAPAAAAVPALVGAATTEDKPKSEAEFIAADEPGLSPEERERLKKALADTDKGLATIRRFKLETDVSPAFRFQAMKSARR